MDKDSKHIVIFSIILVIAFGLLFGMGYYSKKPRVKTLDEMIQETLDGKITEDNFIYNGYVFVKVGNLWYTEIKFLETIFQVPLHFNPKELENISWDGSINEEKFNNAKEYYITFDPDEENLGYLALSAAELSLNMARAMQVPPIAACTKNMTDTCLTRPIITCNNTDQAVIYLKKSNETKITLNNTCITIQGYKEGIVRATDRVIYQWYSVMS